ncbi:toll/interleukin-1 receptor domain-containing protein [Acaryochloris sp. 'Moss Beach']|uniref:toll/interleukin-1 receptor domain-containing protein n=1 Tax=Acaryochloris sp. 'Moss Beach' TaxID=2740837 RepID=UPI0037C18F35
MDLKKLDTATQPSASPRALISYSHDSKGHSKQVLDLANQLRADGIDCRIDQYISNPSEGWPLWMDKQVEESDFVLIVFTERYTERSQQGRKSGVRFESVLMLQELYEAGMINDKFIPIVFEQKNSQHIHKWLKPYSYYVLESTAGYESLRRRLMDDPAVEMPALGPPPTKKGPIQP